MGAAEMRLFPTDPMPFPQAWFRTPDFPDDPDPYGWFDDDPTDLLTEHEVTDREHP